MRTLFESAYNQRLRVLELLKRTPGLSREEIAGRLNLRISSVCGRVHELIEDGAVIVVGSKTGTAGVAVETLGLAPVIAKQRDLVDELQPSGGQGDLFGVAA